MNWDQRRAEGKRFVPPEERNYTNGKQILCTEGGPLDARCAGCQHIRTAKRKKVCPYVLTPRDRITWPCYFRSELTEATFSEVPNGPKTKRGGMTYGKNDR